MSFLDKIASAIMPPETAEDRATARRNAENVALQGGWFSMVLDHHRRIEAAFSRALAAEDSSGRLAGLRELALVLSGHSIAEEATIYPALADIGEKTDAGTAYDEQAMAKVEMAKLELLDPMSTEWREKLQHIQGAVEHHVYREESEWFPKLQQELPDSRNQHLTERYCEEFTRYEKPAKVPEATNPPGWEKGRQPAAAFP